MGYNEGGFPFEAASKLGHMRLVTSPAIRKLMETFEAVAPSEAAGAAVTGRVDVDRPTRIRHVITIDGGEQVVPNPMRRERSVVFLQICAHVLRMSDYQEMRRNPLLDPRDLTRMLSEKAWYNPAVLPLSGIRIPGQSLRHTIRDVIDATLVETGLYDTLRFLVSREWDPHYEMPGPRSPAMTCWQCGGTIVLPRSKLRFPCPACNASYRLSDYLGIAETAADERAGLDVASAFRNVLETLTLFHFAKVYLGRPEVLDGILFIKDGPLLLRAALGRLVRPIEALIRHIRETGHTLHLVGVEKSGALVDFADEFPNLLPKVGDFFLPNLRFLREEIQGRTLPEGDRYRSEYGSKVLARVGPHHVLALQVPTGNYAADPKPTDLLGWKAIVCSLAGLTSYQYKNALVPIVLANSVASIAQKPSGRILQDYAWSILDGSER